MTTQAIPGWLDANEWTSYPFLEDNDFSSQVVDAQIAVVDTTLEGWKVVFTAVANTGVISVVARMESQQEVLLDAVTSVKTVFGVYELWTASSARAIVTLVVKPFLGSWGGVEWEIVPNAISYSNARNVLAVSVYDPFTAVTTEVVGPGESLDLVAGDNTNFSIDTLGPSFQLTVKAEYDQTVPCDPGDWRLGAFVTQLNGLSPNVRGEMRISGGRNYVVKQTAEGELELRNISKPCADCQDYESVFLLIKQLHLIFNEAYVLFQETAADSNSFVLRLQSIMNTDIIKDSE